MGQMNMDALRQNLTPQRVYLWEFEIPAPKGIGSADIWIIRAQAIEEPGRSFAPIDIPYKGTGGVRIPGKETYDHEFTVRVLEGEDAKTYEAVQSWMRLIRDNTTGIGSPDPDLKTDAIVTLLDSAGNATKRVKVVGMFPQNKGDVALDYATNEAMRYEITFAFDRWEEMTA